MVPEGPQVRGRYRIDRFVTLSSRPTKPNCDGGTCRYRQVRGEYVLRFRGNSGGPSPEAPWQVVGRGFGGIGEMVTVAVERGRG